MAQSDRLHPSHRFSRQVPEGDSLPRLVCKDCGFVDYENPKVVVGAVAATMLVGAAVAMALAAGAVSVVVLVVVEIAAVVAGSGGCGGISSGRCRGRRHRHTRRYASSSGSARGHRCH